MTNEPEKSVLGVATITEIDGKAIIIAAQDLEALKSYLEANGEVGAPVARKVAIILGPEAK